MIFLKISSESRIWTNPTQCKKKLYCEPEEKGILGEGRRAVLHKVSVCCRVPEAKKVPDLGPVSLIGSGSGYVFWKSWNTDPDPYFPEGLIWIRCEPPDSKSFKYRYFFMKIHWLKNIISQIISFLNNLDSHYVGSGVGVWSRFGYGSCSVGSGFG